MRPQCPTHASHVLFLQLKLHIAAKIRLPSVPIPQKIYRALYSTVPYGRELILRQSLRGESEKQRRLAHAIGIDNHAKWCDFLPYFEEKTVFILGSGSSIRNLSRPQFESISRNTSIAFNLWPAHHRFVPNYFFVERADPIQWASLEKCAHSHHLRAVLVTELAGAGSDRKGARITSSPASLADITHWYAASPSLGRLPSSYRAAVTTLLKARSWSEHVVMGPKSTSVERAIVFSASAGARQIVLCGIDLSGPYFWEPTRHDHPHSTDGGTTFATSVRRRLSTLISTVHDITTTKIFLGESVGRLADEVPEHFWTQSD